MLEIGHILLELVQVGLNRTVVGIRVHALNSMVGRVESRLCSLQTWALGVGVSDLRRAVIGSRNLILGDDGGSKCGLDCLWGDCKCRGGRIQRLG